MRKIAIGVTEDDPSGKWLIVQMIHTNGNTNVLPAWQQREDTKAEAIEQAEYRARTYEQDGWEVMRMWSIRSWDSLK